MNTISNIKTLLINELKHCYHSERRQIKAYPKLIRKAQSQRVRRTLEMILKRKEENITQMNKIFDLLEEEPKATKILYRSTKDMLEEIFYLIKKVDDNLSDSIIISHIRQINNHDRERYNTAISYTIELGMDQISEILHSMIILHKSSDPFHLQIENETLRQCAAS